MCFDERIAFLQIEESCRQEGAGIPLQILPRHVGKLVSILQRKEDILYIGELHYGIFNGAIIRNTPRLLQPKCINVKRSSS